MSKVSFQSRKWRNRIFNLSKVTSVNRNCQSKFQVLPIYISGLFSSTEFIGDHTLEYHIRSYQSAKLYQEQAVCCTEQTVCWSLLHSNVFQFDQSNGTPLYCSFILDIYSHLFGGTIIFSRIVVGDNLSWKGMK